MIDEKIMNWRARPYSWSQHSSFAWNKWQWFDKYILDKPSRETPELAFGKKIGEQWAKENRLPGIPEHELKTIYKNTTLLGYADFWHEENKHLSELKTGVNPWTQKRADDHGQLTFYCALLYLTRRIRPEDITLRLVWCETEKVLGEPVIKELPNGEIYEDQDYTIRFVANMEPRVFATKRTLKDVLLFLGEIERSRKEMESYAHRRLTELSTVVPIVDELSVKV